MKVTKVETDAALDTLVLGWIQCLEDVHFRCISRMHYDETTGDEFLTVYDPVTDRCLTVCQSPSRFGNEVLELARGVLSSKLNPISRKGGQK